jgi:hypothetical protein
MAFAFIFRSSGLIEPYINANTPLTINYIQGIFNFFNQNAIVAFFISTFIVLITSLQFNKICNKHELVIFPTYLPAYFYIVLNSVFIDQFYVGPVIFVNLFIILSLGSILDLYHSENPYFSLFSASFLAGLSSLLNMTYIVFFLIVIIGVNIFRPFNFRENLSALFGFLMPLYIGTMFNYLINGNFLPYYIFFPDYGNFNNQNWVLYSALPMIGVIGILAILRMNKNYTLNSIKQRRSILLMIITLIASVILMVTGKQNPRQEFSFVAIPLAYFFSFYFTNSRINFFKELINLVLLGLIAFFHYWN